MGYVYMEICYQIVDGICALSVQWCNPQDALRDIWARCWYDKAVQMLQMCASAWFQVVDMRA